MLRRIYNSCFIVMIMGFWPVVLNVLKNSDVVLLVCDARAVSESWSRGVVES